MTSFTHGSSWMSALGHRITVITFASLPILIAYVAHLLIEAGFWSSGFAVSMVGITVVLAAAGILVVSKLHTRFARQDERIPSWWLAAGIVFWLGMGAVGLGQVFSLLGVPTPFGGMITFGFAVATFWYLDRVWIGLRVPERG